MLLGIHLEDMLHFILLHATHIWWRAWPYSTQPRFGGFFLIQLDLLDLLRFFHGPGHSLCLPESESSPNLCKSLFLIPFDLNYYLIPRVTYFWASRLHLNVFMDFGWRCSTVEDTCSWHSCWQQTFFIDFKLLVLDNSSSVLTRLFAWISWQKISDPRSIAEVLKQVYVDHSMNIDKIFSRILETTQHPAAAASFASIMFAPQAQLSFSEALSQYVSITSGLEF